MLVEGLKKLEKDSELYTNQIKTEASVQIGFRLIDTREEASLIVHEKVTVVEYTADAIAVLTMQSSVFNKIMRGEADFGALIGRSKMSDVRPINFEIKKPERFGEAFEALKALMNVFFTPGKVKVRMLSRELSGSAHGAHPLPLVYWEGLRYAWYHVDAGEVLNQDGEKDPYPQAFHIIEGKGVLELEETTIVVESGKVYYIPPNGIHKVHAETDIEMTWLAWNTPP